jgi:hypothetical protein
VGITVLESRCIAPQKTNSNQGKDNRTQVVSTALLCRRWNHASFGDEIRPDVFVTPGISGQDVDYFARVGYLRASSSGNRRELDVILK